MKLDTVRIVLVGTTHPGNIGATARAMKTMGLTELWLVQPKLFPDQKANEMAAGADDILNQAKVVSSLDEALVQCHYAFATSARARELGLPGFAPAQAATYISEQMDAKIAIVFGREHAGLTNEELLKCHYHINIPANPQYSSLNLSQAVQLIAYELRIKIAAPKIEVTTLVHEHARIEDVELFYAHLRTVLKEVEFLKPENEKKILQRMRRLFNRIHLEPLEVNILRGILTQVQSRIKSGQDNNG
jgi:tRNA (cytidine32/uridine32-2'-O)-methyltransferase